MKPTSFFRRVAVWFLLAAGLLTVRPAAAQAINDINVLNVAFRLQLQSPGYNSQNGKQRVFARPVQQSINTKNLLDRLALDKKAQGLYDSSEFPNGARLAVADTNVIVVTGNNRFIVDVSDIVSFSAGYNDILSGVTNNVTGLADKNITELILVGFRFDDTFITNGSNLSFAVQGLDTVKTADTSPQTNTGKYTEKSSDLITGANGEGQSGGVPFVMTGSIQGSRTVTLIYTPTTPPTP
jgi:hypothetical protein